MAQDNAVVQALLERLKSKRSAIAQTLRYDRRFMRVIIGSTGCETNNYIKMNIAKAHCKTTWHAMRLANPAPRPKPLMYSANYYQDAAEKLCSLGHHEYGEAYMEQAQVFKGMAKCLELGIVM